MRLLFCHDGPMAVDCNGNAYPQTFTEQVLSRYYSIAKELVFFTRTRLIDPDETEAKKVNMEKLTIVNSPNLSSIRGIARTCEQPKFIIYSRDCTHQEGKGNLAR